MAGEPTRQREGEPDIARRPHVARGRGLQISPESSYFHWVRRCGTVYPGIQGGDRHYPMARL